jgi:uncharacterized membrane protein (UPF0127 family)
MLNKSKSITLVANLIVANSFRLRAQGLIGRKILPETEGIWFPKSNWIHTLFMSIPIDVIYLDGSMRVHKLHPHLQPWRFPAPVFGARSVLEVASGFIERNEVELGDTLYVGD